MSEHTHQQDHETHAPGGKPSQAEGERQPGSGGQSQVPPPGKPSQAEGERATIEADLDEQPSQS